MAGIIPKPIKKTSRLYEFAPRIAFGLALAVALSYVALFYLENRTSQTLWDLEEKIAQVGTKDEKAMETQVLLDKREIDDFSKLFADHKRASNFFKFLEENSHPKVWFNKLEINLQDSQAALSGEAASFEALGQQMAVFQSKEIIKNIEMSDLYISKNGRAGFTLSLSLDPKIFK